MRAVVVSEHGSFDKLVMRERADPTPGCGDVLVKVEAVGINHLDTWVRRGIPGHTFPLPLVLGSDVSGVVAATGAGVTDLELGDEVIVAPSTSCGSCRACLAGEDHRCAEFRILGEHRDGGCADLVCAPRAIVMRKPSQLSFVEAAGLGIPFVTAWHMLVARARVEPLEFVVVRGAGGAVGTAAIQIARIYGARVIAVASSPAKLARARELGAELTLDSRTDDVPKCVKAATSGRGADIIIDHVGKDTWQGSLKSLAWHGRMIVCGATTGSQVQVDLRHLFFKQLSLLGSTMGTRSELRTVIEHAARGTLVPVIHATLPLMEVAHAHAMLESRSVVGKIVLVP